MTSVLSCHSVAVCWEPGERPTLSGITFSVAARERVALVGLNGSGKTTLLMTLVGLLPHEGEITICGQRLTRRSAARLRDRVGFLFNQPEDQLLFPRVVDDVAFGLMRSGVAAAAAAEGARAALARMGVAHLAERSVHHLSQGQKQRVALAGDSTSTCYGSVNVGFSIHGMPPIRSRSMGISWPTPR